MTTLYRVWFEQINEQVINVVADDEFNAKMKAIEQWKCNNSINITDIRVVKR